VQVDGVLAGDNIGESGPSALGLGLWYRGHFFFFSEKSEEKNCQLKVFPFYRNASWGRKTVPT
jgi:hypothetical protein